MSGILRKRYRMENFYLNKKASGHQNAGWFSDFINLYFAIGIMCDCKF